MASGKRVVGDDCLRLCVSRRVRGWRLISPSSRQIEFTLDFFFDFLIFFLSFLLLGLALSLAVSPVPSYSRPPPVAAEAARNRAAPAVFETSR